MEQRTKCVNCGHYDVCKNREAYKELMEKHSIRDFLKMLNDIHESFNIEITCNNYKFDWNVCLKNSDSPTIKAVEVPTKKSRFGLFK